VELDLRDSWIGWNAAAFLDHLDSEGTAADAKWLHASIDNLLDAVYVKDCLTQLRSTFPKTNAPEPSW
jgi:hypothetical protein